MKAELIGKPTHIQVYETEDYDRFVFLVGNRALSQIHVKELVNAIKKKDFLPQTPIIVNEEGGIIDGQHRLLAAKALSKPIYYIIRENATLEDAVLLNTSLKNWSNYDYFESWVSMGKPEYIKLKEFMKKHEFSLAFSALLLTQNYIHSKPIWRDLKNGDFKIVDPQEAEYMANLLKEFRLVCQGGVWMNGKFLMALTELKETVDPRKVISQLEKYRLECTKRETKKEYMEQFYGILEIRNQFEMTSLV